MFGGYPPLKAWLDTCYDDIENASWILHAEIFNDQLDACLEAES